MSIKIFDSGLTEEQVNKMHDSSNLNEDEFVSFVNDNYSPKFVDGASLWQLF